jgi:hypothetical protein
MKRFLAPLLAALLAGCSSAHTSWGVRASSATGSASVNLDIQGGSSAAALLGIALFAVAASSGERPAQNAPELDAARRVNEQDCSKPIKDWSANLKCR